MVGQTGHPRVQRVVALIGLHILVVPETVISALHSPLSFPTSAKPDAAFQTHRGASQPDGATKTRAPRKVKSATALTVGEGKNAAKLTLWVAFCKTSAGILALRLLPCMPISSFSPVASFGSQIAGATKTPTPASAPPRPIRSEVAGTGTIRPTYPYDNHVLYHPTRS
jgi:hypothetical protein